MGNVLSSKTTDKIEDTAGHGVFREIHYSDTQFETKGRVKQVCVCKKSGLLLVVVDRGVLVWSLVDGCYYREFSIDGDVDSIAEHPEGKHFYVGIVQMNTPVIQKILFTRRIAAAAFANLDSAGRDKGIDTGKIFAENHTIRYDATAKNKEMKAKVDAEEKKKGGATDDGGDVDNADVDVDLPSPNRVRVSRRYQVTDAVTRILPLDGSPDRAFLCAVPDIVLWDFAAQCPAWVYRAFYPNRNAVAVKTDDDKLILGQKGGVVVLYPAEKKRDTYTIPGLERERVHELAVKGQVVFAASDRAIVKYNMLSRQTVRRWNCAATVGRMVYESGLLFVVGRNRSHVDVIDGKCGRLLGAYRASVTQLIPETLGLWENILIVVDSPEEGQGFKTLVKTFALSAWFSHLPWLCEYAALWGQDYKRPVPQLLDEVFAAGPLSVLLTADNQGGDGGDGDGGGAGVGTTGAAPYKHLVEEQKQIESIPIQKYGYTVMLRKKQYEASRHTPSPPPAAVLTTTSPGAVPLEVDGNSVGPSPTQRSDGPSVTLYDTGIPSLATSSATTASACHVAAQEATAAAAATGGE